MIIPVKVYTGKSHTANQRLSEKIKAVLQNYDFIEVTFDPRSTFDDIMQGCATKCGVSPVCLPLFALWNPYSECWLTPNANVESSGMPMGALSEANRGKCIEFRVRSLFRTDRGDEGAKRKPVRYSANGESGTPVLDGKVNNYLYHQQREDFLRDKIKIAAGNGNKKCDDKIDAAFSIATFDMVCMSLELNINVKKLIERCDFKQLFPESLLKQLSPPAKGIYNKLGNRKRRLRKKFQQYLKYFSPSVKKWRSDGHGLSFLHSRYLLNLEMLSASHGVEQFHLREESVKVSADHGICIDEDGNGQSYETWCDFSSLVDMSIKVKYTGDSTSYQHEVILSRLDGSVRAFVTNSKIQAEDLASCVDMYYRLLVDPHHCLCKDVCPGELAKRLRLGCHGPIDYGFAEKMLRERRDKGLAKIGDCVIRQSQEKCDEYLVTSVGNLSPLEITTYKIDRDSNGMLGLYGLEQSHLHASLPELLQSCSDCRYDAHPLPFSTSQIVFPNRKMRSNLVVRLCSDLDGGGQNNLNSLPNIAMIDLTQYKPDGELGYGCYTQVARYSASTEPKYVAVKSVFEMNKANELAQYHHAGKTLMWESMVMLNNIKHEHIVQLIGVTSLQNTVAVLEYVPNGSITTYLQSTKKDLGEGWGTWFLQVLWQMAHACNYMEEFGIAHGSLRAKNILVGEVTDQPHIKLADPGVSTHRQNQHLGRERDPLLPAPWLASEFCGVDNSEPDFRPTVPGDKWSFATTVCEILNWGRIPMEPTNWHSLTSDMKSRYSSGEVMTLPLPVTESSELSALISGCWGKADRRPAFQKILSGVNSMLSSGRDFATESRPTPRIPPSIEYHLETYDDEKLTHWRGLGEGRFGKVDLFLFDPFRNGRAMKVAIKSPQNADLQMLKEFSNEMSTMRKLDHKYVVRLLGTTTPSRRIVMEYVEEGSLLDYVKDRNKDRSRYRLLQFSSQIAEGMMALQELRLIHRDLAARNILVAKSGNSALHIKISDFGLARILREDAEYYLGNPSMFPAKWYAPECLCVVNKEFGLKSDVWSYGVAVWEMFSYGSPPEYTRLAEVVRSENDTPLLQRHLEEGNRLPRPEPCQPNPCPEEAYSLMLQCWAFEPSERITFEELKAKFDFLVSANWVLPDA